MPRWYINFYLKPSLAAYQYWNVGIYVDNKLYKVPLRLH